MSYNLSVLSESANLELKHLLGSIQAAGEWATFHHDTRKVCNHFLTLAASSLLAEMDRDKFFVNLYRCAENWHRYLELSRRQFHRQPSLFYHTPLHAAVITGDQQLLIKLRAVLPERFQKGEAYEAPFHTCWLQIRLSTNGCILDEVVRKHLTALEECEKEPAEAPLIKALLELEDLGEADFWGQFESLLYLHEENIEARAQDPLDVMASRFPANRFIWFEGVVWLNLARKKGFVQPSTGYAYCPDEALVAPSTALVGAE